MEQSSRYQSAYNAALAMLARRDHSAKELERKLQSRFDFDADSLGGLLGSLHSHGYQCDERFAESYTRARMRKGFGPKRIKMELKEKGINESVISDVVSRFDAEWLEVAQQVRRKKYTTFPGDFKEKARQSHFLRYRGFNSGQIQAVFE